MRLNKLLLKNFLTYEDLEYDFVNKPLLVQGINLTDDKQKSNGTGKSGMQAGIEFCITASNSRDVRDSELITYGEEEAIAQLYAECDIRKEIIHIYWTIRLKGSNKLKLSIKKYGDEEFKEISFSNINDGKKYILEWFDISKEDLFSYFLINKSRFKSFFKSSNREKVALINRFSDASIIEGIENIDKSDLEEKELDLKYKIIAVETRIEDKTDSLETEKLFDPNIEISEKTCEYKRDIKELEVEIDDIIYEINKLKIRPLEIEEEISNIEEEIKTEKEDIKSLEGHSISINSSLSKINLKLNEAQKLVDEFKETNWDEEREDFELDKKADEDFIKEETVVKEEYEDKLLKINKLLNKIKVDLSGAITCPNCNTEFVLGGDITELNSKKKKAKELKNVVLSKINTIDSNLKIAKNSIDKLEFEISNINKKESKEVANKSELNSSLSEIKGEVLKVERKLKKNEDEINDSKNNIRDLESDIKELENEKSKISLKKSEKENSIKNIEGNIEIINVKIRSLEPRDNKERINTLKKELSSLEVQKTTLDSELIDIGDDIYMLNQWTNNFKQFKIHIANQSLEVMEYHCNRYLEGMGSDLKVKYDGYKVLASGKVKDEITTKVIRNNERTFDSFSGGEKGRLLFASILANRFMINSTHKYGGLDFLSVDEVFEGVDSIGLKHLVDAAKELRISVMIITHVTDEDLNDDILTIVKENGKSIIKN